VQKIEIRNVFLQPSFSDPGTGTKTRIHFPWPSSIYVVKRGRAERGPGVTAAILYLALPPYTVLCTKKSKTYSQKFGRAFGQFWYFASSH
jgi:hypothetical protein